MTWHQLFSDRYANVKTLCQETWSGRFSTVGLLVLPSLVSWSAALGIANILYLKYMLPSRRGQLYWAILFTKGSILISVKNSLFLGSTLFPLLGLIILYLIVALYLISFYQMLRLLEMIKIFLFRLRNPRKPFSARTSWSRIWATWCQSYKLSSSSPML